MDELTLEAVTHHNEGSQLSGENLAVEIEPLLIKFSSQSSIFPK